MINAWSKSSPAVRNRAQRATGTDGLEAWTRSGRWYRGQLHCHSDRSDGTLPPGEVIATYRDAGYDWLVLSDHFEAEYGWAITDTSAYSDATFTAIPGAELSAADWTDRHCYWITAAGLPFDFPPPDGKATHAEAIRRAADAGAFIVMLHPGLNNLPLSAAPRLPHLTEVHAVEIYNHSMAVTHPYGSDSSYFLDGLLEAGYRVFANAGDDAHFIHPSDHLGGWMNVRSETNSAPALLDALKAGAYYSTQGPRIDDISVTPDGRQLHVTCDPASAVILSGSGGRWLGGQQRLAPSATALVSEAVFDLDVFAGSYCRVTVVGHDGLYAWSNPIWL